MARSERAVIVRDLFVGVSTVVTAVLIAYSLDRPTAWPLGAVAVLFCGVIFVAADRSTAGIWGLTAGLLGSSVACAAVLWWLSPTGPVGVLPPLLFGLGGGTVANRLLFGLVHPLPDARRRRENVA